MPVEDEETLVRGAILLSESSTGRDSPRRAVRPRRARSVSWAALPASTGLVSRCARVRRTCSAHDRVLTSRSASCAVASAYVIDLEGVRRLNFGCGYDKRDGYLNVDIDPACEPDILLLDNDLSVLPPESFEEILAMDVLEHIPRVETPRVLVDWSGLLVDGGKLRIQTSSIEGVAAQIARDPTFRGQYGWTLCLFGTQAHPGDFHLTGFTETTLKIHLLAAGFDVDRIWITDRWLLNAEATKVTSWSSMARDLSGLSVADCVRAIYSAVLRRDPNEGELAHLVDELSAERMDRYETLRHVTSSPERLFVVAEQHGFAGTPKSTVAERVRPHVPDALVPPLRTLWSTARTATSRGRRALGSLNGQRLTS